MSDEVNTGVSSELATIQEATTTLDIPVEQTMAVNVASDDFDSIVSTYLPRIQLFDFNTDAVKSDKIKAGHYGIVVNTNIIPAGKDVVAFYIAYRLAALDMRDGFKAYYDHKSPDFLNIAEISKGSNSRCLAGPEFLLYLPEYKRFVTFMMGSKTAKREAGEMRDKLRSLVTLKSKLISADTYKWFGPVVTACSTPHNPPAPDRMNAEIERFRNPPKAAVVETAPDNARTDR